MKHIVMLSAGLRIVKQRTFLLLLLLLLCKRTVCKYSDASDTFVSTSFETTSEIQRDESWTLTSRLSMWKIEVTEVSVNSKPIHLSADRSRTDNKSLKFDAVEKLARDEAYFVSKHVTLTSEQSVISKPIRVSFWTSGSERRSVKFNLDVSYKNNLHLFLSISPNDSARELNESFIETCVFIPNYGPIRALMTHFVLDEPIESPVYVDDVSVTHAQRYINNTPCSLYLGSYPIHRHVIPNFLVASSSHSLTYGISIATQLTEDRLDRLELTAELWKGPVSASVLLYGEPSKQTLDRLVYKYHESSVLPAYVTIHLIWEDKVSEVDSILYPVNYLRNVAIAHSVTSHVLYLDADVIPACNERQLYEWTMAASDLFNTNRGTPEKIAYILPTFHVKKFSGDILTLPTNKRQLLDTVRDPANAEGIEALLVSSHGVVQYHKWYDSFEPYEVSYQRDMEPYFVVHSEAPLMSDLYSGYGRDKCAYSRDLYSAGYRFIVLPQTFLLNLDEPPHRRANTIYHRSAGLQLQVFMNIAFHARDLESGHYLKVGDYLSTLGSASYPYRMDFFPQRQHEDNLNEEASLNPDADLSPEFKKDDEKEQKEDQGRLYEHNQADNWCENHNQPLWSEKQLKKSCGTFNVKETEECTELCDNEGASMKDRIKSPVSEEANQSEDKEKYDLACYRSALESVDILKPLETLRRFSRMQRSNLLIEDLMESYGVTCLLEISHLPHQAVLLNGLVPMLQPDCAVVIMINSLSNPIQQSKGVQQYHHFSEWPGEGEIERVISDSLQDVSSSKLYIITAPEETSDDVILAELTVLLYHASDDDVIVIGSGEHEKLNEQSVISYLQHLCQAHSDWTAYRMGAFLIFKHKSLTVAPAYPVPQPPECISNILPHLSPDSQHTSSTVDIILFTKNRPLQTFAFIESLIQQVSGVGTVWILVKSEDNLFDEGYRLIEKCLSNNLTFKMEFIHQTKGLGKSLYNLLTDTVTASFVMFAVDEMIWLRPVDLRMISTILQACDESLDLTDQNNNKLNPHPGSQNQLQTKRVMSAQLRLGRNLALYNKISQDRFYNLSMQSHPDLMIFYPRRLPFDFGYVLNVDGPVFRRQDFLKDMGWKLDSCSSPSCIEQGWIRAALHERSLEWHVMYETSRTVNNMGLVDQEGGPVATRPGGQASEGSRRLAEVLVVERRKIDVNGFAVKHLNPSAAHISVGVEYIPIDCGET